ncbi:MAG: respiratory chain complex I subunit 1 family protein [Candidatus Fervidibacter sp.]|uniref:respiratory chain complex I subunit 1 family protein n=1 Tax=Candidatus Fervidibacter sp. TaxID=3100871 RepID=UPI004049A466
MVKWQIALAWVIVAPIVLLAVSPLLDGLVRKIRARLHSRIGPPIIQGYLDLVKLAGKADVTPTVNALTNFLPFLALSSAVAAGVLLPVSDFAPLSFAGDLLLVLYLLGLSTVAIVLGGAASGNPYSLLGAGRELQLLLFVEPVLAFALFVLAVKAGTFRLSEIVLWHAQNGYTLSTTLAGISALSALLPYFGKLPFDLAEAEQEIMGGILLEQAGWRLVLYRWTFFVKWFVVTWLFCELFLPILVPFPLSLLVMAVKVFIVFCIASVFETLLARLRLDHARAFFIHVAFFVLFALAFALIGS